MFKIPDTSTWNDVDFSTIYNEEELFAFIFKATDGVAVDKRFFSSVIQMNNLPGSLWAAYHYFRITADPIAQANNFYNTAKTTQLPPILDVEKINNLGYSKAYFTQQLEKVVNEVERLFQREVWIYTSYYAWTETTTCPAWAKDNPLWVANYQVLTPKIPAPWSDYILWQYTDRETFGGYHLDSSYFYGTREDLFALANQQPYLTVEQRLAKIEADIKELQNRC